MADTWLKQYPEASPLDLALAHEGVDGDVADIARSIYTQESSGGKITRTSNAGAVGGMQVTPGTFKEVADPDWSIKDPVQNARAGVRYVKAMYDRAEGDPKLTAVGYYGGPGAQDKARQGVAVSDPRNPNAPDTLQYAEQVTARVPKRDATPDWLKAYPAATAQEVQAATKPQQPSAAPTKTASAAPAAASTRERRTPVQEFGRQLALTLRAAAQGAISLPAVASDAVTGVVNEGLDAAIGKGNGFRFQRAQDALGNILDKAGVAKPETATERVVQDVGSAMTGAGTAVKAGQLLANAASPVAAAVGEKLAEGAGMQIGSAATGSGASGVTREEGGGTGAQIAAGVAGSLVPGFAAPAAKEAARRLLRGGEAGRQQMADNIARFEAAGTTPTLGQATGGRTARAAESLLAKTPGGAGVIAKRAQQQSDDLQHAVQAVSEQLAPDASAVNAGEAISRGVKAFKEGFKDQQRALYKALDAEIDPQTPIPVQRTAQALRDLNEDIPNAPALSKWFQNSRIRGIWEALKSDTAGPPASVSVHPQPPKAGGGVMNAPVDQPPVLVRIPEGPPRGTLPYEALRKLRTLVGNEITDAGLVADVPRSKWNALYAALSDDLGDAAKQTSPQAEAAWSTANDFTRRHMQLLDDLATVVNRDSPEKVFLAAISGTSEGDTTVRRVMNALPVQERRQVTAAVLQRLGRATAGQQNAEGDAFSSETFLTNLAKMSAAARKTIFGRTDVEGIEKKVADLASVAESRREGGRVFANPSGTAAAGAQQALNVGGTLGAVAGVATGNFLPLAGALAVPAVANTAARIVTNPEFVRKLAQPTSLRSGAQAAAVEAAARTGNASEPSNDWLQQFPEADLPPAADSHVVQGINGLEPFAQPQGSEGAAPGAAAPAADGVQVPEPVVQPEAVPVAPATPATPAAGAEADPVAPATPTQSAAPDLRVQGDAAAPDGAVDVVEAQPDVAAPADHLPPAIASTPAPVQPARSLSPRAMAERIAAFTAAGDKQMADVLSARHQRDQLNAATDAELSDIAQAHGSPLFRAPEFTDGYRALRLAGMPAGEALDRTAVGVSFESLARSAGLSDRAIAAGAQVASGMHLGEMPGFLGRYVEGLAKRGVLPPEAAAQIAQGVTAAHEQAIEAALTTPAAQEEASAPAQAEQVAAATPAAEAAPAPGAEPVSTTLPDQPTGDDPAVEAARSGGESPGAVAQDAHLTAKPLRDGTLLLKGDTQEIQQALLAAGVPQSAIVTGKSGVVVGRKLAEKVQKAIDAVHAAADVDARANEAATSPQNDRPEPTPAQQEAGNYKKGHIRLHGMDIAVENPKDSVRRGVDADGQQWESRMGAHYGYVKQSQAGDGDHVDVFIGPSPGSHRAYVVDQLKADGSFDEPKGLLAFNTLADARAAYLASYQPGWERRIGAITELPVAAFRAWVKDGVKNKPLGEIHQQT